MRLIISGAARLQPGQGRPAQPGPYLLRQTLQGAKYYPQAKRAGDERDGK